jgi:hypothetical protein
MKTMSSERFAAISSSGKTAVDDRLREAFDDGGLADAGLTDEHRVVLGAAREDLDGLLDLVGAADHGVEGSTGGQGREVGTEAVEHRGVGIGVVVIRVGPVLGRHAGVADGLAHALRERVGRDAGAREHLTGR